MKRFARALVVVLGLAVIGSVVSLVPQKNVTAQSGPIVTIGNPIPLPVKGNLSATVSGTVGVNNFPATQNVNVTNPSIPVSGNLSVTGNVPVVNALDANRNRLLLFVDNNDAARHSITEGNGCSGASNSCTVSFLSPVSAGQVLVIREVDAECFPLSASATAGQISLTVQISIGGGGTSTELIASFPVTAPSFVNLGSNTLVFEKDTLLYVPGPTTLGMQITLPDGVNIGGCNATVNGYFINQ